MKRASLVALVVACGLALAACGSDDDVTTTATTTTVATVPATSAQQVDVPAPVSLSPAERAGFVAGRDVATLSGCLACHRIGASGNDTPGSNLTGIGERRSRAEIRRALMQPPAAMPSYRELAREQLDALVSFLVALDNSSCPGDSDCG